MCGICGFNFENKPLIKKMCNSIVHRGPDDSGYFIDSRVSLGMRRLSIIDLQSGNQPQHNENEDIWIVYNGEIYNFNSLRKILEQRGHNFYTKSDTEVIIHAYEEWGNNCLKYLRGQFAFCIYDSQKKILFLARDHIGLKPLYYHFDGNLFIFGSEIKCILSHNIKREINRRALNLFFSLGYVIFNETLFLDINKLPNSSFLIFNLEKKEIEIKKYWSFSFNINHSKTEEMYAKELRELLTESVKLRLISDVPLGVFLSGGIDSTSLVALMNQLMEKELKTFSIGFEKGAPTNELKYAKLVSEFYNTNHKELIVKSTCYEIIPQLVWHFDDLISDPAIIPVYFMSKLAKEYITVGLTGDGADELLAGYAQTYWLYGKNFYRYFPKGILDTTLKYYKHIPSQKLQIYLSALNSSIYAEDRFFRPLLRIKDIEKSIIFPFKYENVQLLLKKLKINGLDDINQYINFDLNYQLPNQYNMKNDKMSMATSFEIRVPFLDYKLVEWASTLPTKLKLRNKTEKFILRRAMKDLLPLQILQRKKQGFGTPVSLWLKTGMKEISAEILGRLEKRKNLMIPKYVRKVKKNRTSKFYQFRTWTCLMFELWYETFIDNEGIKPITI